MHTNGKYRTLNKKGNIPITILVIGVIAVCVLTIFSFWNGAEKERQSFVGAGLIETIYSMQEENKLNKFDSFQEKKSFNQNGVKIDFEGDKINATYVRGKKVLVEIEYTPIK